MSIQYVLPDYDKEYLSSNTNRIIVNELYEVDPYDLKERLVTYYRDSDLDTLPSCECGNLTGEGVTVPCNSCGELPTTPFDSIESVLWMKSLNGTPKFIHPHIWSMVSGVVSGKYDILRWVGDSGYNSKSFGNHGEIVKKALLSIDGFERSYGWLCENLVLVIQTIINHGKLVKPKVQNLTLLLLLIEKSKDVLFMEYLPITNRSLFVLEINTIGNFTDMSTTTPLYSMVLGFVGASGNPKLKVRGNIMARTISTYSELSSAMIKGYLSGKHKLLRKNVYGTRQPYTGRGVIIPLTVIHRYDDLVIPWGAATVVLRPHIVNKLIARGYTPRAIDKLTLKSYRVYDPIIDEIITELISESNDGLGCMFMRNPSLMPGSILKLRVRGFFKDPRILAYGLSPLLARLPNFDFDGDEMTMTLTLDDLLDQALLGFLPHKSTMSPSEVISVSGLIRMQATDAATISNSLRAEEEIYFKEYK